MAKPGDLVVAASESAWTEAELAEVREELQGDVDRLRAELASMEADVAGLVSDSGAGAGDDSADISSKAFEREHEASLAETSRVSLEQAVAALARLDDGTFGVCAGCGEAVGKARMQAFPRATLCMSCKQKERR